MTVVRNAQSYRRLLLVSDTLQIQFPASTLRRRGRVDLGNLFSRSNVVPKIDVVIRENRILLPHFNELCDLKRAQSRR
jgi:hypothetical protein